MMRERTLGRRLSTLITDDVVLGLSNLLTPGAPVDLQDWRRRITTIKFDNSATPKHPERHLRHCELGDGIDSYS
jgi:hypothetical protein